MNLTKQQEKNLLVALLAIFAIALAYRMVTSEKQKALPLVFERGATARSPVRRGLQATAASTDPLVVFFERRHEHFPGVTRDLFRMENAQPKKAVPVLISQPVVTAPAVPLPPPIPEKTPEEIAAELARADLSKFRFLGYLTDTGKDSSLFLSKEGELFIVKSGDTVLKNYKIKTAGKDFVQLLDTVTRVEVRVELSGSGPEQAPLQKGK